VCSSDLALGDEGARALGVGVRRSRIFVLLAACLLAASSTAFCGPIAFIGMASPHIARGLFRTETPRVLLFACCLVGALIASLAGFVSQLPGAGLPLNAITSLVGVPVVLWVLLKRR
jgi:iron complex transport system permease protein